MVHQDHLGTKATVTNGEAQWLTAGSGAFHSEMPGRSPRFLGVQLWLNLPARDKMTAEPFYHGITRDQIKEFDLDGGKLRLLTGSYGKAHGFQGKYLPLDYYDILLDPMQRSRWTFPVTARSWRSRWWGMPR
jgi:redox-sensitive bicupin YhaK (pirin superfamily)